MTPFITDNATFIANYTQQAFQLQLRKQDGNYRKSIRETIPNDDFAEVLQTIPDPIDRHGVSNCFSYGLYEGFIATLLWGGKHLERYGGFQNIINNHNKLDIVKKLSNIKTLLENNQVDVAYNSMLPHHTNTNNIVGVNTSFITKILYFLSNGVPVSPRPIILDNVMQWVRCAFMIEDGINYHDHYELVNGELKIYRNNYSSAAYIDYITMMRDKAKQISAPSDKLEAFLFSICPMPNGIVPRQFVRNYVINNF